jgi:prepilin-type N-terminal cleavage/methylation domain-containing protein
VRRARGFSLTELIVSLAVAALVVAGAFQLHLSFNRQSQRQRQSAELSQTLRVAMQLLERAVRSAGRGLPSTHALTARVGAGCTPVTYYGFQFSNDNGYNDPKTTFSDPALPDGDPDWFRVVAADDSPAVYAGSDGDAVRFVAATPPGWQPGDLFLVVPDQAQPPSPCALACRGPYEVGAISVGRIEIRSDGCYGARLPSCAGPGSALRRFSGGSTVYRVDRSGRVPTLTMRSAPFGTPVTDATYRWIPLAPGIEDLQVAVVLADGTTCTDADDPRACNFGQAVAVRLTLVGRSAGAESEATRRSITSLVQLRNYAP